MKNKFNIGEAVFLKGYDGYSIATIDSMQSQKQDEIRYNLTGMSIISSSGYMGYSEEKLIKIPEDKLHSLNKLEKQLNKIKKKYDKEGKQPRKLLEDIDKKEQVEINSIMNNFVMN